jgi:Uma2 family endonuclease
LVIEVLSPSTSQLDYEEKKIVYERFGVHEYFIIDPNSKSVESFFLKNKEYEEQETLSGKIVSKILGTTIKF